MAAHAAFDEQSRVSLDSVRLAPIPEIDPNARAVVIDDRPVVFGAEFTWIYDQAGSKWTRTDWRPQGEILGMTSDGHQAFVLSESDHDGGHVTQVERVTLAAGLPESDVVAALPARLDSAQAALQHTYLIVAGITDDGVLRLFSLNLLKQGADWVALASQSVSSGSVSSLAAQHTALLITIADTTRQGDRLLQYSRDGGWRQRNGPLGAVVPGTGHAIGQAHVLYLVKGGSGANPEARVMVFQTITGSWATLGDAGSPDVQFGAGWKDGILWIQPRATGSGVELGLTEIRSGNSLLAPLDWIVLAVYLLIMLGIGFFFYNREKSRSSADFFVGGRSIPFWAAGISLYATNVSSISYIAIPAKAFETNWQYLTNNLVAVAALIFVAIWIVPVLRRLDLMSVFHYLENRFHPAIRMLSSTFFILVQMGSRMSIILFLPSLAISTVTGIDVVWSILIMGVTTIVYTALGGIKAVIWTDFIQLIVMFGGALFSIGFIILALDGGIGEFLAVSMPEEKMKLFDWSWDLTEATVWGFIFLVLFDVVLTFPKDQVLMQRVLSTKSAQQAGRSVWTFAAIMFPGGFLFYLIGTALYAFYRSHPERMDPTLAIDATFPQFIAAELPIGITGLIIAGIFAASMSTLSSILNSVATVVSVDFYEKLAKNPKQTVSVRLAEWVTVAAGLIGMMLAYLLSRYDIRSLFDLSIELAGLLGGGFAGAYTLGMFTRRANWQGVILGVAASISITLLAWSVDLVHPYFYLAISILVCIVVGYLASWFFPPPNDLAGLTILEKRTAA
ncbi:MAG: sodium:solute symporter [Woeseiaceae bacterium]